MSVRGGWRRIARMMSVARVEVLHLIHDPTTISLILLVPAIQIVLFGYAVNLDPRNIPIAIAGDHNGRAPQLRSMIQGTGYFAVSADGLEPGAAERMVAQGEAVVGVELPPQDDSDDNGQSGEPQSFRRRDRPGGCASSASRPGERILAACRTIECDRSVASGGCRVALQSGGPDGVDDCTGARRYDQHADVRCSDLGS
jgi:hypothetical protein